MRKVCNHQIRRSCSFTNFYTTLESAQMFTSSFLLTAQR
jgi:hypothetical protein